MEIIYKYRVWIYGCDLQTQKKEESLRLFFDHLLIISQ